MKQVKWGTANIFTGFIEWTKVWLTLLQAKQTKKMYKLWFVRLKAKKKGTPDEFSDSTALRKVSLKHLVVKMSEIDGKAHL